MLLAQITDLHMRKDETPLSGEVVTRPYIAAAVDAVNAWAPDALFVTGDLTDIGSPEEYALLRAEFDRLEVPYFLIPGNHDRRENLRAAFPDHAYIPADGPIQWVIDDHPVRLIGLDTVVPGKGHGEITADSLDWLHATLTETDKPAIIGMHHPPFPTGIVGMDNIMCLNGADMAPVVAKHAHVERIIAGHHHRPIQIRWGGTIGQIAPSVAHQVVLDFADRARPQWVLEPPAFLIHKWTPAAGVITHTAYIGDFGGAREFKLDPDYPGGA